MVGLGWGKIGSDLGHFANNRPYNIDIVDEVAAVLVPMNLQNLILIRFKGNRLQN